MRDVRWNIGVVENGIERGIPILLYGEAGGHNYRPEQQLGAIIMVIGSRHKRLRPINSPYRVRWIHRWRIGPSGEHPGKINHRVLRVGRQGYALAVSLNRSVIVEHEWAYTE